MPNARIANVVPNARAITFSPNTRVSSFQTGRSGEVSTIPAGTPIGLLLVLTYGEAASLGSYSDFRPNVRIQTY